MGTKQRISIEEVIDGGVGIHGEDWVKRRLVTGRFKLGFAMVIGHVERRKLSETSNKVLLRRSW